MRISVAADHNGYELKNEIKKLLKQNGHEVIDIGPHSMDPLDDYPDYAKKVAKRVKQKKLMEQFGDKNPESKQSERPLDDLRKDPKSVILPYAERYAAVCP